MDTLIHSFDASVCALIALLCGWAVLSHKVQDGVIIKTGLIWVSLGCMVSAWAMSDGLDCDDMITLGRAQTLVHVGILFVAAGLALRLRGGLYERARRASDWLGEPPKRSP